MDMSGRSITPQISSGTKPHVHEQTSLEDRYARAEARIGILEDEQNTSIAQIRDLKTELEILKRKKVGSTRLREEVKQLKRGHVISTYHRHYLLHRVRFLESSQNRVQDRKDGLRDKVEMLEELLTDAQERAAEWEEKAAKWEKVADNASDRAAQHEMDSEADLFELQKERDGRQAVEAKIDLLNKHARALFDSSAAILGVANHDTSTIDHQTTTTESHASPIKDDREIGGTAGDLPADLGDGAMETNTKSAVES